MILSRERPLFECENVLSDPRSFLRRSGSHGKKTVEASPVRRKNHVHPPGGQTPLLGDAAVPVTIKCGDRFRSLVITGPNTGGKTVVLKTAGVCVYLAWCGLPIPAGEDSVVGNIGSIFADIGDEQSIEQNLSTFSAHVKNIISILEQADRTSLVLLDELGAGRTPRRGQPWGRHPRYPDQREGTHPGHNPPQSGEAVRPHGTGVETASMEFDIESLSLPTGCFSGCRARATPCS